MLGTVGLQVKAKETPGCYGTDAVPFRRLVANGGQTGTSWVHKQAQFLSQLNSLPQ